MANNPPGADIMTCVTIVLGGLTFLLIIHSLAELVKLAYAYGERSAYRKQNELTPEFADGPKAEHEVDLDALLQNYARGDEWTDFDEPGAESDMVRVNVSGGKTAPPQENEQ